MNKYMTNIKPLSKLILSPRESAAIYLGDAEREKIKQIIGALDIGKPNMLYPFFQYGCYNEYDPEHAQYYIPGSSIKGALGGNDWTKRGAGGTGAGAQTRLIVDDVPVDNSWITVEILQKLQYIRQSLQGSGNPAETPKQLKLDKFFQNVAVEMLNSGGTTLQGTLYWAEKDFNIRLRDVHQETVKKLIQMKNYVESFWSGQAGEKDKCQGELSQLLENLNRYIEMTEQGKCLLPDGHCLVLFGGYKGLALSGIFPKAFGTPAADASSAVYLDIDSGLPYGLAEFWVEEENHAKRA